MARKVALIIGSGAYEDTRLARLKKPEADVTGFSQVLRHPEIGGFDEVETLIDHVSSDVRRAIARFFTQKSPDDTLLLYFSGHGLRDDRGRLFLATTDTEEDLLSGSAIPSAFITEEMDRCRSRRQIMILDCCYSGAFEGAKGGASVGTAAAFEGNGFGRVVLTATDSTQFAWEGEGEEGGSSAHSLFTQYLIRGLETGEADRDGDGKITIDELYDYAYELILKEAPRQTPGKWSYKQQGDIVLARSPIAMPPAVELPAEFRAALDSPFARVREGALHQLGELLAGRNAALAKVAREALTAALEDDSRRVSSTAAEILKTTADQPPSEIPPAKAGPNFGPAESSPAPAEIEPAAGKRKPADGERIAREPEASPAKRPPRPTTTVPPPETSTAIVEEAAGRVAERHPRGLYVLFFSEMWERFSYSLLLALWFMYLSLYLGYSEDRAVSIWQWFLAAIFAGPLIGGWLADWKLGYRRSAMLGGLFFLVGYALLAVQMHVEGVLLSAMACLAIGNGFYKPSVFVMVGNLYPQGSHLRDRGYYLFNLGASIGTFLAAAGAEIIANSFGFQSAFFMGAIGLMISLSVLWFFKRRIETADRPWLKVASSPTAGAVDAQPKGITATDRVSNLRRILTLIVILVIYMVFLVVDKQVIWIDWVRMQYSLDLSAGYRAIDPAWIILLTLPLIWFWRLLDRRGKEPSTPTKMVIGLFLVGLAYFVMYIEVNNRVSPGLLIGAYGLSALGSLMIMPMGPSLISKVAPVRLRGLMMGGWCLIPLVGFAGFRLGEAFSPQFFALLGGLMLLTAVALALLLRQLKKAMPEV